MKKPNTLTMLTAYDRPLEVSIADLLLVMPVLTKPDKIQAYTKEGCVFLGDRVPFEMAIKENQQHQLDSLGNKVWIDRVYWSDAKQKRDGYRALCALGGMVELKSNDIEMVVQKGSVYTIFTKDGVFFKPVMKPIGYLCPMHAFQYAANAAWRKGTTPDAIQRKVYGRGLGVRFKE